MMNTFIFLICASQTPNKSNGKVSRGQSSPGLYLKLILNACVFRFKLQIFKPGTVDSSFYYSMIVNLRFNPVQFQHDNSSKKHSF